MRVRFRRTTPMLVPLLVLLASCGEETPSEPRLPDGTTAVVAALDPSEALVGSSSIGLVVSGERFADQSSIHWNGESRPTSFVSPRLLTAAIPASDLDTQGTFPVTVVSPDGALAEGAGSFVVVAAAPSIRALSPDETPVDVSFTLDIVGEGFYDGTVVRFGSEELATNFIDPSTVRVRIDSERVPTVGSVDITVRNPEPGGGESDTLKLTVFPATTSLEFLSSEGASSGGQAFELAIYGSGFRSTSRAFWNGEARPTTKISHEQLRISVSASDVTSPSVASLTVQNPAPSGAGPASLELAIRTVGAPTITGFRAVGLEANDIGYSESTGLLYVSVPSSQGPLGNTITAIDPLTGSIQGSVLVGSEPTAMAISDDGLKLWVALDGSGQVRGVDLPSLTAGTLFDLTFGVVEEIEVMPGTQSTVAISHEDGERHSPRFRGLGIYDEGTVRPEDVFSHTGSNTFAFDPGGRSIYGYNNESTGFVFFTLEVDAAGVRLVSSAPGLIDGFYQRVRYGGGRIYATSGAVVDAGEEALLGNLGRPGEAVAVDVDLGRVFVLDGGAIETFDINTLQSLGQVVFPRATDGNIRFRRQRLIRWGADGLALRDGVNVYVIRTPLAAK